MPFTLHPQLEKDCLTVGDLETCRVLLMNNAHFPWLVLVPMREGLREIFDLPPEDYVQVMEEMRAVTERFAKLTKADKMNVAALGNMVPQLHIHVIARFASDSAWPGPVWNASHPPLPYDENQRAYTIEKLKSIIFS